VGLRHRIGFVLQQFALLGSRTVLENVCAGAPGRLRGPRLGLPTYPRRLRREALEHLTGWGWRTERSSARTRCPAASSNGSPWHGH
jgi:ABC-type phosphate/phosphonate transport system ATPase subunit